MYYTARVQSNTFTVSFRRIVKVPISSSEMWFIKYLLYVHILFFSFYSMTIMINWINISSINDLLISERSTLIDLRFAGTYLPRRFVSWPCGRRRRRECRAVPTVCWSLRSRWTSHQLLIFPKPTNEITYYKSYFLVF